MANEATKLLQVGSNHAIVFCSTGHQEQERHS